MSRTAGARFVLALCGIAALFLALDRASSQAPRKWYKGNLHTHTTNSDGDSPPLDVAQWYKANGYHFLVLSDHDFFSAAQTTQFNTTLGVAEKYLLIPGEEISSVCCGSLPVHINGYGLTRLVPPITRPTVLETIQADIDAIRAAQGLPSVNHPNFNWAVKPQDLIALRDLSLFEVYNGHPAVNNGGDATRPSLEVMWDMILSAGRRLYGIAVDDAHAFKTISATVSNPGRGWVVVRATSLSQTEILQALNNGEFYSSTGVELSDVQIGPTGYRLVINPVMGVDYRTSFIGGNGRVLAVLPGATPSFPILDTEPYIRARVDASNGTSAWAQPVFPQAGQPLEILSGNIKHAAALQPGAVAPGQIVSIFGSGIGPAQGVGLRINSAGVVDTELAETQVLFDGQRAPLLYVRSDQINVVVPYGVAGKATTRMQVVYRGRGSTVLTLPVVAASPGVFTADGSGAGLAAALNEDGSYNSTSNPAARGSVVVLYLTGEGQTNPPGIDGKPAEGNLLPKPRLPVTAKIGGVTAEIIYAGAAPGLVAGVMQVNLRIPESIDAGDAIPITILAGSAASQSGVMIAVQ